jgi:hypothetical protein
LNVYQFIDQRKFILFHFFLFKPFFLSRMLMVDRAERRPMENFAQTILRNTVQRIAPEWITTPIEVFARAMCFNTFTKDRPSIEILDNHAIFRLSEQPPPSVTQEPSKASNDS